MNQQQKQWEVEEEKALAYANKAYDRNAYPNEWDNTYISYLTGLLSAQSKDAEEKVNEPEIPYCYNYEEGKTDERCSEHCGMEWCKPKEYDPLDCFHCGHSNNYARQRIAELETQLALSGQSIDQVHTITTAGDEPEPTKYDYGYIVKGMKIHIDELEAQLQDAEERVLERENAHLRMAATYQKKIKELTAQLQSAKSEAWDACYVSMIQNSNGELNENAIDADKAAYIGQ
jgi:hypothetical protein